MKTIVAITAQNRKTIFEHAGRCRNFLIYTIEDGQITNKKLLELTKEETLHNVLHSNESSVLFDIDILLTRGIGNGAIQKLANHSVACYKIEETDPDEAINKLITGTLEAVAPVSDESHHSCSNHNHEQPHEDGHSCGCH